jgi:hypothetical protein
MAKFVRKVNAQIDAKAMCFFAFGQRRGSLGLVGEGVGTKMILDGASLLAINKSQ